jgi:hypothetical protein
VVLEAEVVPPAGQIEAAGDRRAEGLILEAGEGNALLVTAAIRGPAEDQPVAQPPRRSVRVGGEPRADCLPVIDRHQGVEAHAGP